MKEWSNLLTNQSITSDNITKGGDRLCLFSTLIPIQIRVSEEGLERKWEMLTNIWHKVNKNFSLEAVKKKKKEKEGHLHTKRQEQKQTKVNNEESLIQTYKRSKRQLCGVRNLWTRVWNCNSRAAIIRTQICSRAWWNHASIVFPWPQHPWNGCSPNKSCPPKRNDNATEKLDSSLTSWSGKFQGILSPLTDVCVKFERKGDGEVFGLAVRMPGSRWEC